LSEEQAPHIVESNKNSIEIWEPKEAYYSLHTQEVRGSSPCAPTIPYFMNQEVASLAHLSARSSSLKTY